MNDAYTREAAPGDDWLDTALRAARPPALADDGFTARVMAALPPVIAASMPAWRKPAVATLWTLAAAGIAISLPGVAFDVVRDAYRVFTAYPVSTAQLAFAVAAAATVMWTAAGYAVKNNVVAG